MSKLVGIGKCGCFTATTLVLTANGAVPIVDIEAGHQVLSAVDDGLSQDYSSNEVGTKIIIGEAALVQLQLLHEDGSAETINTTDEHPFHVAETAEWTRADQLLIGDELSTISGTAKLQGVTYTTARVPVYNLSIPGSPTYYVGEHGVWVHNCGFSWNLDTSHVMQSKHAWDRIGVTTIGQAKEIMEEVLYFGLEEAPVAIGNIGTKHTASHLVKGEYVTVTYSVIDDVIRITDGWVVK